MRNSKAVGVLWGIFSVCYTVLIVVVFLQVRLSTDFTVSEAQTDSDRYSCQVSHFIIHCSALSPVGGVSYSI